MDTVELSNINAFANFASAGGAVSLLDAQLLQDVTFLTGGYPAPYIHRTSSVLQVTQREGNRKEPRADGLRGFLTSLADGRATMADHDLAHRRSEP